MRRPLVGITSYVEQARWGVWDARAVLVPEAYVAKVEDAGALAVLLPPATSRATEVLGQLDAVVFAGGADLDPGLYGEQPHAETVGLRPERDDAELTVLQAALDRDLPVLGICRGMQLMAVAAGGRLEQHLPDRLGNDRHRPEPGVYGHHPVRLQPGSRVHGALGPEVSVRSYHHQGVADAGRLTVTGWSDDGLIEAVEDPGRRFAVGVLWHPEAGADPRLFEALVASARRPG